MNAIVPFNPAQLPAAARQKMAQGQKLAQHFTEGVGDPINVLSIKGKNFNIRLAGVDPDPRQRPMYEIDVVILDGTPNIGKTYYIDTFKEGSMAPPDCWSLNGIKPDPSSPHIQAPTCRGCQWNVFGSKVSTDQSGVPSKSKACGDSRRVAVIPIGWVNPPEGDPPPLLMRVPATSLKPLKEYAVNLERMGAPVNAVVTRLGFQNGVSHPQLTFTLDRVLTDAEFQHVDFLNRVDPEDPTVPGDERLRRILEAPPPAEEMDPSEFQGQQITNRTQAPPVIPAASVPAAGAGGWKPGQVLPVAPPSNPAPQPAGGPIQLPDGKWYDPATGQYVEPAKPPADILVKLPDGRVYNQTRSRFEEQPEPEPEPERPPDGAMQLPDGKWYDPKTQSYWEPAGAAAPPPPPPPSAKSISQRAAPVPPSAAQNPPPPPPSGPAPTWRPATQQAPVPSEPSQGFTRADVPAFIQKDHPETAAGSEAARATQAAPAAPPAPKKRAPAKPPSEQAQATQQAPAALDALLGDLMLDKK